MRSSPLQHDRPIAPDWHRTHCAWCHTSVEGELADDLGVTTDGLPLCPSCAEASLEPSNDP